MRTKQRLFGKRVPMRRKLAGGLEYDHGGFERPAGKLLRVRRRALGASVKGLTDGAAERLRAWFEVLVAPVGPRGIEEAIELGLVGLRRTWERDGKLAEFRRVMERGNWPEVIVASGPFVVENSTLGRTVAAGKFNRVKNRIVAMVAGVSAEGKVTTFADVIGWELGNWLAWQAGMKAPRSFAEEAGTRRPSEWWGRVR